MNIYIAGLNYSMNDADLANLFAAYGEVTSAKVIVDNYSKRSKGFGFVEMSDVKAGQTAIEELNGKEVEGKTLLVNVARERTERPSGDRGGFNRDRRGGGGFNRDRDSRPPRKY
ncbi:MAG: RNA-binding protein [Bacteroidales bacterium]|jgi:RNA recognition motif-containing protein|nr:RNA-binding protein [Bacteroidales bacterium]